MIRKLICPLCDKEFETNSGSRTYCSDNCLIENADKRKYIYWTRKLDKREIPYTLEYKDWCELKNRKCLFCGNKPSGYFSLLDHNIGYYIENCYSHCTNCYFDIEKYPIGSELRKHILTQIEHLNKVLEYLKL